MAKNNIATTQVSTLPATAATSTLLPVTDSKLERTIRRARCFLDIIGQSPEKPKRVRGRFGGETTLDDRHFRRREGVRDRAAARRRSEQAAALAEIASLFEGVAA